jgi:hypothetical protein
VVDSSFVVRMSRWLWLGTFIAAVVTGVGVGTGPPCTAVPGAFGTHVHWNWTRTRTHHCPDVDNTGNIRTGYLNSG